MDERSFRLWMESIKNYHTARTYTARCHRVEMEMNVDLDEQFLKDRGITLLLQMKYSRKDSRDGLKPKCGITFDDGADIYTGMHSLRASVKKYFEFKQLSEKEKSISGAQS